MNGADREAAHRIARLRGLIVRPGAWLDGADGRYLLRIGRDRRARITTTLDEAEFRALAAAPGLACAYATAAAGGRAGWKRRSSLRRRPVVRA